MFRRNGQALGSGVKPDPKVRPKSPKPDEYATTAGALAQPRKRGRPKKQAPKAESGGVADG